jgi:hypothetical protein
VKRHVASIAGLCVLVIAVALPAMGAKLQTETLTFDPEGAKEVMVNVDFSAGELRFRPADIANVAEIEIRHDPEVNTCDAHYRVRNERGYLNLESRRHQRHLDTDKNRWDIALSSRYTQNLDLDLGAADISMDLGGLAIGRLMLDVAAASCEIDFSEPNQMRLKEISVDAGASSLEVTNLGNARVDRLNFSGGVGAFHLDFSGDFRGQSTVAIDVSMGAASIVIPEDLAVQLRTDGSGWFSKMAFDKKHFREVHDGIWETDNYESAEDRLVLDIDVGMGAVDIDLR